MDIHIHISKVLCISVENDVKTSAMHKRMIRPLLPADR